VLKEFSNLGDLILTRHPGESRDPEGLQMKIMDNCIEFKKILSFKDDVDKLGNLISRSGWASGYRLSPV